MIACASCEVLPEPGEAALPAVRGGFLAEAGPVVGVEAVRRVRVDHELALTVAGSFERIAQILDRVVRNAAVRPAVETEHRRLDLRRNIEWCFVARRERPHRGTVPGHCGLELRVMRRVHQRDAAAPTEPGHAEFRGVAAVLCR